MSGIRSGLKRDHNQLKLELLEPRRVLATFAVSTFADVIDQNDGVLSLREAVIAANSNAEDDLIELASGTYTITIDLFGEDAGLGGDFDVSSDGSHTLKILGQGSDMTIIDANQIDRAFETSGGSNLTLDGLTIRNGDILDRAVHTGRRGGAIKSTQSYLQLDNVVVENSTAGVSGVGGAIYISGGSYAITDATIQGNYSELDGAAVFARQSNGNILRGRIQNNAWRESTDDIPTNDPGIIAIRSGSLHIQGTRIDNNNGGTGIAVSDGMLDVVHARFLDVNTFRFPAVTEYGHSIHARDSQVTVHDTRFNIRHGDAIRFFGQDHDLIVTESLFISTVGSSIRFDGAELSVTNSDFEMNRSFYHNTRPVILVAPGSAANRTVTLSDVVLRDPTPGAIEIDGRGSNTQVTLDQVVITSPEGKAFGSGQMVDMHASEIVIRNSSFLDESMVSDAGYILVADSVLIEDTLISKLINSNGVTIDAAQTVINNLDLVDNKFGLKFIGTGSSLRMSSSSITGMDRSAGLEWKVNDGQLIIYDSRFFMNDSRGGDFSTVTIKGSGNEVLVANSRFTNEITFQGALGIYGDNHQVIVANSLFADGGSQFAAGVYSDSTNSSLSVDSSTFVKNGNGAVNVRFGTALDVLVSNSILIANGAGFGQFETDHIRNQNGTTLVRFSAIDDLNPGDGNIYFGGAANSNTDAKPAFVDYTNGDYHLKASSPLRDLGNAADLVLDMFDLDNDSNTTEPLSDLDLLNRVFGSAPDMGAFEFQTL